MEMVEEKLLFTKHNIGRKRARYVEGACMCMCVKIYFLFFISRKGKVLFFLPFICTYPHLYIHTHTHLHTYRLQAAEVNKYARGETDWLDVVEAKKWNALGVLAVVVGLVSAVFALLIGDWMGREEEKDA